MSFQFVGLGVVDVIWAGGAGKSSSRWVRSSLWRRCGMDCFLVRVMLGNMFSEERRRCCRVVDGDEKNRSSVCHLGMSKS